MRELPSLEPDGLVTPVVGDWADDKYQLFWCYAELFAASMKDKWQHRVLVDLFAGSGRARIRGTNRVIPAPPLLALDLKFPFTRYIFSEFDKEKLIALRTRVQQVDPNADVHYVAGDTNANIGKIIDLIPTPSRQERVLTFCFADPYRLADLPFGTIRKLATARYVDFLVLVPSGMDASGIAESISRQRVKSSTAFSGILTGGSDGTTRLVRARGLGFVVDEFGRSMANLKYQYEGIGSAHLMSSTARHSLFTTC